MNGMVKVPMQFFILFIGAMDCVFYQFASPSLFFNPVETKNINSSPYAIQYQELEKEYSSLHDKKIEEINRMLTALDADQPQKVERTQQSVLSLKEESESIIKEA